MKQLRSLRDEIDKKRKRKLNLFFFFFSFFLFGCKQPLENKILGTWEIDHVSFSGGTLSTVFIVNERYTMVISKKANKKTEIDDIQGSWYRRLLTFF